MKKALQLATGVPFSWWALPVGLALWLFLWKGTFSLIENGGSLLGLVTLCLKPKDEPGFSATYTLALLLGVLLVAVHIDPLKLTIFSMTATAVSLPFAVVPFLLLMNDERYVGEHRNGRFSNAVVLFVIGLAFVLALVSIPLEIAGS